MKRSFLSLSIALLIVGAIGTLDAPACAEMLHLEIDPSPTKISASVMQPLSSLVFGDTATPVVGTFHVEDGEVDGDPANVAKTGHVHLWINATTYDSGLRHRDKNVLKSVLETANNTSIIFDSTRIEDVSVDPSGNIGRATVVGNLNLHSTTREIRVPVRVSISPEHQLFADGEVTFKYTDWGVKRAKIALLVPASDEVTVKFHVVANPPATPVPATTPTPTPEAGLTPEPNPSPG
jgi:polyisoprenoid-binding protein YceI